MAEELVPQGGGAVATPPERPDWLQELAKTGEWLCRIDQGALNSEAVAKREREAGNFYYVIKKGEEIDLGKSFDAFVIAIRPKALDIRNIATPLGYYDMASAEFQKIQELSKTPKSGCLAGPEFLIWIPKIKKFAAFFYGSKSAKQSAGKTADLIGRWVTYDERFAKNTQGSWYTFSVKPCMLEGEKPPQDKFDAQLQAFKNPKSGPEKDESAAAKDDR
jgi:hypothetical protein